MQLNFSNLPLVEVTLRVAPGQPVMLDVPHLADAIVKLRECGFNDSELSTEYHFAPGAPPLFQVGPGAISGLRFRDAGAGLTLILQSDLILLGWQNPRLEVSYEYPRFPAMLERLRVAVEKLRDAGLEFRDFRAANMSYRDFVRTDQAPTAQVIRTYLRSEAIPELQPSDCRFHETNLSWKTAHGTDLRLHIQGIAGVTGIYPADNGFALTSIAGRLVEPIEWPGILFEELHAELLDLFDSVITKHAREEWGYAGPA
ncbi:MAG: TIGR04255 family protein [Candidatus Eremiobacterota bacterium]